MSNCEQFPQIAQDKWATVSKSLRSFMSKEQLCANCSDCSWQKSNRERFAQVAHDKWENEQIAHFFQRIAHSLFRSPKTSDSLKKCWLKSYFWNVLYILKKRGDSLIPSLLMSDVSKSLRSLSKNEQFEGITQVLHQKRATMSDSLRSITKNEQIARFFERIDHSLIIRSFFHKKSDWLRKPMSEFPTLFFWHQSPPLAKRSWTI